MLIRFLSWLFWRINLLVCSTLKYKAINEPAGQAPHRMVPGQALFALWHGQTFPLFYWAQHRKLCLFPTAAWRGEMIYYLAKKYGYRTIRYSEEGTPLEKANNLAELEQIIKVGYDAAIAVDGPPPPLKLHKAKPGILFLSQKTGVPVVPVGICIQRKIVLFWRWDRYEIPLPFSEVNIVFGKPFVAQEGTTTSELEGSLLRLGGGSQNAANRSVSQNN